MAFNPFNIFRRNQRAIFAVITVFIMFTFVLSSGLGGGADFFDWFPRWLSGKGKRGEAYCTLDGSKIGERDVYETRRQRVMANRFMSLAAQQSAGQVQRAMQELMVQATPQVAKMLQGSLFGGDPAMFEVAAKRVLDDPQAKAADKDLARTMKAFIDLMQTQSGGRDGHYFADAPNQTSRDVIDFLLWDKKAEQLGIRFTTEDVKYLIQKEFMGQFRDDREIRKALERDIPGFSLDAVLKALATEFRVRAAQTALLGNLSPRADHTPTGDPAFNPPFELFEFYRDKMSPTTYQVLSVPSTSFMGQVTGEPSESDLQRLFNEHKDAEPDPSKEAPGFKEPRKIKLEWVSATGEEPYYKKAAAEVLAREEQVAKSELAGLIVPLPGTSAAAWAAMTTGPMVIKEPVVYGKYQQRVDEHRSKLNFRWGGSTTFMRADDILDTSVVKPQNLAAVVGGAAGGVAGFGNALLPTNLLYGAAVAAEQRARVRAGIPLFLAGVPGPGQLTRIVGAEGMYRAAQPEPLPVEALKPELLKQAAEEKARALVVADLKKLQEEVNKLTDTGKKKDVSAAKTAIAEFAAARGLKLGTTTDAVSEWTIGDDPGFAPLKALTNKPGAMNPHGDQLVAYGERFFYKTGLRGSREPATGLYAPELYPERPDVTPPSFGKADPVFLAWRTDDQPAKGLTFAQAKPRVIEAWKRAKARELAKAEAERLANEQRAKPGRFDLTIRQDLTDAAEVLRARTPDAAAKDRVKRFEIRNVAPFVTAPDFAGGRFSETVRPFRLEPSANIPYPTQEMQKTVLEDRTKPVNTVAVLPDQPKDTYYVLVVANREERGVNQFRDAVYGGFGMGPNQVAQALRFNFRGENYKKAKESVLALLKKEFKYQETDEQKKRLDDSEKRRED